MGVVIDSSIIIGFERRADDFDAYIAEREEEEFFLSVVSVSELLHGVERASNEKRRAVRSAFVEAIIERFPIYPITVPIARAHAKLWATLARSGMMIGMNDSWIAATCLACSCTLVTSNLKEFHRVPGLQVEQW